MHFDSVGNLGASLPKTPSPAPLWVCLGRAECTRPSSGPLRSAHTFQHFHEYPESAGDGRSQWPCKSQDTHLTDLQPCLGPCGRAWLRRRSQPPLAFKLAVDITLALLVEEGEDQSPSFHQWLHYHLSNSSSATYDICKETKKPYRFIKVWEALSREAGTACRQHEVLNNYGTSETYNPHTSHSFFHPNRLPAGLTQDQPSPNGRGVGWEAENGYQSVQLHQGFTFAFESLYCAPGPFSILSPVV